MGLFKRNRARDAPDKRNNKGLQDFIKGVDLDDGSGGAASGAWVSEESAMRTSAVYACVKILAETAASLPLRLFKGTDGGAEKAEYHPLYDCLYQSPNPETTSFVFRENMMTALLLWGNAYAEIIRGKGGHVGELWYLRPDRMSVSRDDKRELAYEYAAENGQTTRYCAAEIFHIKGLSFDGVKGLSPIGQMREAVGLSLATEQYGAAFFGNGARPGGIIEFPGVVKDVERVKAAWNRNYQGAGNANRTAVLEEGAKYHVVGINPEEAQFLETRKFQLNEICRIFRVPPHLVGDLDKATYSNIEHQGIEFLTHTVRPWLVRWEQEIARSLLSEGERRLYYARFNADGLLRGDYASRMQGYSIGRQYGWLSANDIRRLEEMNPIPAEEGGDSYMVLANMIPVKTALAGKPQTQLPQDGEQVQKPDEGGEVKKENDK